MIIIKQKFSKKRNEQSYYIYDRKSYRDKETKQVKKKDKYLLKLEQVDIDSKIYKYLDFSVLGAEYIDLGKILDKKFNNIPTTEGNKENSNINIVPTTDIKGGAVNGYIRQAN